MNNSLKTLSLCMIVKNEEKFLGQCLQSVRNLIDEIIIVDTGSADSSREISLDYGAKLFNYNWDYDFSKARNYALEQAISEWILVLDADEVLEYKNRNSFFAHLENEHIEAYWVNFTNYSDDSSKQLTNKDMAVRLFRNRNEYRFKRAIHESIVGSLLKHKKGQNIGVADFIIHHYGSLSSIITEKNKSARNEKILHHALEKEPDSPSLLYFLACEKMLTGDIKKALSLLQKSLLYLSPEADYFEDVFFKTGLCLHNLGLSSDLDILLSYAKKIPFPHSDIYFLHALASLAKNDLNKGESWLLKCLELIEKYPDYIPVVSKDEVLQMLSKVNHKK